MSNQAAWLDGKDKQLYVAEAELPKAGADQVVIENKFVAVNPVDWKIQDHGIFIQKWPTILGEDSCGTVYEVGSNVKNFKKGDRVIGHNHMLVTGDPKDGGFQLYSRVPGANTAKIPENVSFKDASVLPLAINTAAAGLYQSREKGFLGLEYPTLTPTKSGKTLVVYGASSSVGALVVQLAALSGANVVATASSHNHDFVKSLGASTVIDYKSSSAADDIVQAVNEAGASNFYGIYDAISTPDSYKITVPVLEKLEQGNIVTTLPGPESLPKACKNGGVFAVSESTYPLWGSFITQALEQGKLKAVPTAEVVGKGLENVQKGLDANKKGVSAKKIVIEL